MANNYGVNHPAPFSFSAPKLSVGGFKSTSGSPSTGGFNFKPFMVNKQTKAWSDIENATGIHFPSYAAALQYLNTQSSHKGGKSVGGLLGHLFDDVVNIIPGMATGIYETNKAIGKDIWDASTGDFNFSNSAKIAKAIGHNYAHMYGPLVHGNMGEFWNNVYNNPLGPILDAATVATFGAGAAVKAGSLLAKVGEESAIGRAGMKLAEAGKPEALVTRSPQQIADNAAPDLAGGSKTYRMTRGNPLIKARQKFTFNVTQKSYKGLGEKLGLGTKLERRRYATRVRHDLTSGDKGRLLEAAPGEFDPAIAKYHVARSKLNSREVAAAHIIGLVGTHLPIREAVVRAEDLAKAHGFEMPRDMKATWEHPETQKAYDQAVSDFRAGKPNDIITYRNMADQAASVNAAHKGLDPETIAVRKWSTLAHLDNVTREPFMQRYIDDIILQKNPDIFKKAHTDQFLQLHDNITTRLYMQAHAAGLTMKQLVENHAFNGTESELRDSLYSPSHPWAVAKGKAKLNKAPVPEMPTKGGDLNPIYVPHKTGQDAAFRDGSFNARGTGQRTHRSQGVVQAMGRIAIGEDLLGPEFARTVRIRAAEDVRAAMIDAAVKVDAADVSQMIANGYEVITRKGWKRDFMTETSQKQLNKMFEDNAESKIKLGKMFTSSDNPVVDGAQVAEMRGGKYLMIDKPTREKLLQDYHASGKNIRRYIEQPLHMWKYVVLGLSPRNIATNVVGNTLMAAVFANGPVGAMKIVAHSMLKTMTPEKVAEVMSLKGSMGVGDRFMQKYMPELWQQSFSHGELNIGGKAAKLAFAYRATHRNEIALRQGLLMELIRHDPTIRAIYKRHALQPGGFTRNKWEAAAAEAFEKNPALRTDLSERVDDALGNYRDFSHSERWVRQVMPFYSWYRHAGRTGKALTARPAILAAGYRLGEMGQQENKKVYGNVPEFMDAMVPIGKNSDGTVQSVNTAGLNPFHALVEMAQGVDAALHSDSAGAAGKLSAFMNPAATAGIEQMTKTSLLTGAPSPTPGFPGIGDQGGFIGGLLSRIAMSTPQARLAQTAFDSTAPTPTGISTLTPTGRAKKPHVQTLSKGARTQAYNFLGFPTKDVNVKAAQEWQAKLDQKGEFHAPKSRKKKKAYGLPEFKWGTNGK